MPSSSVSGGAPLALAPSSLFVLGNVSFTQYEAPDELPIAIGQNLAVHDFIGGKRAIQALGTVWKTLKWEGILWGQNAEYRAQLLQRMTAQATVHRLTYLSYALDVVVKDFTSTWKYRWECPYEITVEVLNDASGVVSYATPVSVDSQIQSAVNAATQDLFNILSEDDSSNADLTAAHQKATAAMDAAGPAAQATGATANAALTSIQNVISTGQKYLALLPASQVSNKFLSLTTYVNHWLIIQKNFSTGQAPKTISLNGGSLFDVASQYFGDPSLAIQLMAANGLSSPHLPAGILTKIILPPIQSALSK